MEKPAEVTQKCQTQGTGTNPTAGLIFKTSIGSCLWEKNIWFICKGPRSQENIIKDHMNQVKDLGHVVYCCCHFFILLWAWFLLWALLEGDFEISSPLYRPERDQCRETLWVEINPRVHSLQFYCAMLRVPDKDPPVQVSDSPLNYVFSRVCNPPIAGHEAPDLYLKIDQWDKL